MQALNRQQRVVDLESDESNSTLNWTASPQETNVPDAIQDATIAMLDLDSEEEQSSSIEDGSSPLRSSSDGSSRRGSSEDNSSPRGANDEGSSHRGAFGRDGRWLIEAVAIGDGSADKNGLSIISGCPIASAQARAGHEGFHPVTWDESIFLGFPPTALRLETYAINGSRVAISGGFVPLCNIPASRASRQDKRLSRSSVVSGHVKGFIEKYRGVAVIISGIGARADVPWSKGIISYSQIRPFITSETHDCVSASLVNAVHALCGAKAAKCVLDVVDAETVLFQTLRSTGPILHRAKESVIGCRILRDEDLQRAIQRADRALAFEALETRTSDVYLVRLRQDGYVDHAVVVDAVRRLVIDSCEEFCLPLSADVLRKCGGTKSNTVRVCEVRRIVRTRENA